MKITITDHHRSPEHKVVKIESRGRIYAATWAVGDDEITVAEVKETWKYDRQAFKPYDEATGSYL